MTKEGPSEILHKLEERLGYLERMGLKYISAPASIDVPPPPTPSAPPSSSQTKERKAPSPSAMTKPVTDLLDEGELPPPPKDRARALNTVAKRIAVCQQCVLHQERTNTVPGVGDPHADLMFVGEGPGYHEDQQGLPFVGRAGDLLTKMIQAMGFAREQVFIGNVVKCRL